MLTLDHVAFGTSDLEEASAAFSALGFAPSGRSRCEWRIGGDEDAANAACIVFEREYLDLIEIADPRWSRRLASSPLHRRGFAPTGVVFRGVDPGDAYRRLAEEGTDSDDPYPIIRRFDDGAAEEVRYEFLPLRRSGLPFGLISDSAPHALRRSDWLSHPNGATAVVGVHLRVPSLAGAVAALQAEPLSLATEHAADAGIPVGRPRLHVHEDVPRGYLASVSELLAEPGRPGLLALEFRVGSLATTEAILRDRGVAFAEIGSSLLIEPDQGFGCGIVFSQGDEARP